MSTYIADLAPAPPAIATGRLHRRAPLAPSAGGTVATTYYYRESGGARGSTTSAGSVPAGAVVERVT